MLPLSNSDLSTKDDFSSKDVGLANFDLSSNFAGLENPDLSSGLANFDLLSKDDSLIEL